MQKKAYAQLSALTFFQYLVLGAFSPIMGTYLKDTLHFTGFQIGLTLSLYQACSMASPLVAAFIVDRVVSARLLFASLHLVGVFVALLLASQTGFVPFTVFFGVYAVFLGPTVGLVNSLTFARLPAGGTSFGSVRLWGTLGWIAAALILSVLWLAPVSTMSWMFSLCAVASLLAALGTLALPQVQKSRLAVPFRLFPREAVAVFLRPEILKMGLFYFASGILDRFYFIGAAPFLKQLGFSPSLLMPAMTLGQITEVALLALTGRVLARWGFRTTLLLGLSVQILRFALLSWNPSSAVVLVALSLNGFVFAFFYSTILIYVDNHTTPDTRSGVHQMLMLLFAGTSSLVGSFLSGDALDWFQHGAMVDFRAYWFVPLCGAFVVLALVLGLFRRRLP